MITLQILGLGEITTTVALEGVLDHRHPSTGRRISFAYKRLPSFPSTAAAGSYLRLFTDYQSALSQAGIRLPYQRARLVHSAGKIWVYICQERFPAEGIASRAIGAAGLETCREIFGRVLTELHKVFRWNAAHPELLIGFDGQIPNWVLDDSGLIYLDTSTPLLRQNGREGLNPELFLKAIPLVLRPLVRAFLLQGVLDRYYSARLVTLDLIASFHTFRRSDAVPRLVDDANRFLARELADLRLRPFTLPEVASYHRADLWLWKFLRAMKRMDRFLSEEVLGRPYEQRLPKDRKLEQAIRGSR